MIGLCSAEAIRRAEGEALSCSEDPLLLMSRAGALLANEVKKHSFRRAIFVCGKGNNGGDGLVAAAILKQKGYAAEVFLPVAPDKGEALFAYRSYLAKGYGVLSALPEAEAFDLAVDCLLGTGLTHGISGEAAVYVRFINSVRGTVISCDLPSGIFADGGNGAEDIAVRASVTVTFGGYKRGLLFGFGRECAGKIVCHSLGLSPSKQADIVDAEQARSVFLPRRANCHKGDFGRCGIWAGSIKMPGAARLASRAALSGGCGYVSLFTDSEALKLFGADAVDVMLGDAVADYEGMLQCSSLLVGPGLVPDRRLYEGIAALLSDYRGNLILDAGALTAIAHYGKEILSGTQASVAVTPHYGEMARLTGESVQDIAGDPIAVATAFATKYGVTVLLKGSTTVIAEGESAFLNISGSPCLARGGSGDVLGGLAAGIAARAPLGKALCAAAYLHGKGGEAAARAQGEYGVLASDLPAYVSAEIQALGK